MSFALFVLLHGCGNGEGQIGQLNPDGTPIDPIAEPTPGFTIDTPAPASYLALGSGAVAGSQTLITGITVNGVPGSTGDGTWSGSHTFELGMNVLEVVGTDAEGGTVRDLRSPLAGTFQPPQGFVDSAVQVHINGAVLDALLPMADGLLDPSALAGLVTSLNPVLDDGTMVVNATDLTFSGTRITAVPTAGALAITVALDDFFIPLEIVGAPLGVDEGEIYAEQLVLTMGIALGTDGAGGLAVDLVDPAVDFVGFDFSVNNFIANWFVDDDDIQAQLGGELDNLLQSLPATIDDMLGGLDLALEADILEQTLAIEPAFASAGVDASGIFLGLDMQLDVIGAAAEGAGHLVVGPTVPIAGEGLTAQVTDDFMNRFLHELWAGGALEIDLPIVSGDLAALLLTQLGGVEGVDGALHLSPKLPPVWIEKNGEARLQLGEIDLVVDTPGGLYGEQVEMLMTLDANATLALDASAAGVVLSGANVKLVPRGASADNAELVALMPDVEVTMAFGMGAINDLLSFDLGALGEPGADPLVLPPIEVTRDPSGKATKLDLTVESIVTLLQNMPPPAGP